MTMRARTVARRLKHDDRGSMSPFAAIAVIALLIIAGLVVDGSGRIEAVQRADNVAREAARAAGQAIHAGPAVRGVAAYGNTSAGRRAAQQHLKAAGMTGTVSVSGNTITVTATTTHRPIFLSLVGIGSLSVTVTGGAYIVRVGPSGELR